MSLFGASHQRTFLLSVEFSATPASTCSVPISYTINMCIIKQKGSVNVQLMVMISGHCLVITFLVDVFQFVPTMSYGLSTRIARSADIVMTTSETHYRNTPDYVLMEWCVVFQKQILVLVLTTGSCRVTPSSTFYIKSLC
ncbi:hypothetical protein D5086_018096 [Populus alba]|uniref:Uncharacterized protein n=1 Tax=Populus alba TaxID=43335 RepID=A0ACC4BPZ5_POPAL